MFRTGIRPRQLRRGVVVATALIIAPPGVAGDGHDLEQINRIIDMGFNHSEVATTAAHLTDRIGPRLTNSPGAREAEAWTQARFRDWGLRDVRAEGVEFGRGWSIESFDVRLVAPRSRDYDAIPVAWTPSTPGTVEAPVVLAVLRDDDDFDDWRGRLAGKIVLVSQPETPDEPRYPKFQRKDRDELRELDRYRQPRRDHDAHVHRELRRRGFAKRRDAFLAAEGALAWVRTGYAEGNLIWGGGYQHRVGETPTLPGFEMARDHYRQIARLALGDTPPVLALTSVVRFHDDDTRAYNILADLPGRGRRAGYVMAGAHLDSWASSDGAQDNAAGVAIVMEAARILARLDARPKRRIRFALWGAEEQGMFGSLAYLERYVARRGPLPDATYADLPPFRVWDQRWPITPLEGHGELSGYFNLDNGSGRIRGIYTAGNVAVVPLLKHWLRPFESMEADHVVAAPTRGTDHVPMRQVGIPAFQFIQDSLDWVAHTNLDNYDHLRIDDMRQAAVVLAALLWQAANHDTPLPRMPLPSEPVHYDPFAYPEPDH